jgi:hypothetical protein
MIKLVFVVAIALLSVSAPAQGLRAYLVTQWFENGANMCKYSNGTVLNMGYKICPLDIRA